MLITNLQAGANNLGFYSIYSGYIINLKLLEGLDLIKVVILIDFGIVSDGRRKERFQSLNCSRGISLRCFIRIIDAVKWKLMIGGVYFHIAGLEKADC